jgi:hypothetical protein
MLATIFAAVLAVGLGLAFTFYGLRLFLVLLPVWGFFAGFWLGAQGVALILGQGFLATVTSILVGSVLGILFGVLSYMIFGAGVTLVTAVVGVVLTTGILQALGFDSGVVVVMLALLVAAILVYLLFRYRLDRYLIIVLTALGGASLLESALLLGLGRVTLDQMLAAGNALGPVLRDSWLWLLVWLGVAAVGVVFQIRAHRGFDFSKDDLVQGWG